MNDPGTPSAGRASSDVPLWMVVVAFALMIGAIGVTALALTQDGPAQAAVYPKQWDSRIAPYVKIAQEQRGLRFMHPVDVRFLPAAEFEKSVVADEKEVDAEERKELEQATGLLRALGLITGDVDLLDAFSDTMSAGTLAYYSFEDERITVRGAKVTPAVRATLVHELTHVLQDQHFAIGDRLEKLVKRSEDGPSTTEASVLRAVIEGDASRVETLYSQSLSAKERASLDAGQEDDAAKFRKRLKGIPKVVVTMISSPYTLGQALVQTVAADGGNASVDKLFRKTPKDESALLDPFQVLAGQADATRIDVPKLADGEKVFDSGELGALTWYAMLAERLPIPDALTAADGWGGDAFAGFERDGVSCARMSYAGDTPQDTKRMFSALQRWIAAAPGSPAEVGMDGNRLRFESCDPGTAANVGKDASEDAIALVTTRTYLGVSVLRSGVPVKTATCFADRLVRVFPVSDLVDPAFGADDPAVQAQLQQLAVGCR